MRSRARRGLRRSFGARPTKFSRNSSSGSGRNFARRRRRRKPPNSGQVEIPYMQSDLFNIGPVPVVEAVPTMNQVEHGQYMTPAWFCEMLYDAHFGNLTERDMLWEPGCGTGACLAAVPAHVPAFGTEIDPQLAAIAARRTGRRIIVGDICDCPLPENLSAVFGNPKFELRLVERLLQRCAAVMPEGSKCGLILPTYVFQTSATIVRLNQKWTIAQEMIPRDLFNRPTQMQRSLLFALFTRDNAPRLVGLRGYKETSEVRALDEERQRLLDESFQGPRSVWREVFGSVLRELGGEASLAEVYHVVEGRRPTETAHWKEQLRKVAAQHFERRERGRYALPAAA